MSGPTGRSPHIPVTDEDIAARRSMRTNLIMSMAATALAWGVLVSYAIQNGANLVVAYLFVGTLEAARNMALAPLHYFDRKHPELSSLLDYGKLTLLWLPTTVHTVYLGVRQALSWDDDAFRVERMMNRLEFHRDSVSEEDWLEDVGAEEGG